MLQDTNLFPFKVYKTGDSLNLFSFLFQPFRPVISLVEAISFANKSVTVQLIFVCTLCIAHVKSLECRTKCFMYEKQVFFNISFPTGFHLHSKLPTIVPESCLLIVLGLIVGIVLHYSEVASKSEYVLNAEVFFIYLLPPIIFDAGYFMPIRSFFDNIGSVLLLAVVNTAINTALIGFSLFAVSYWGLIGRTISLLHCLIFR